MEQILTLTVAVLYAVALYFFFNYWPLRKWLRIKTDPSWKRRAKPYVFPIEDEEREERDLFISSTVIRDSCDVIWHETDPEPPEVLTRPLPERTVVHVNAKHVPMFMSEVLPHLVSPIVLVTGCDTVTTRVPGYERIIDDPRVLHWFVQNYELDSAHVAKVTKLPVGLNFHKLEPGGKNTSTDMGLPSRPGNQQLILKAIRDEIPPLDRRPCRVYANFHLNMDWFLRSGEALKRHKARKEALEQLRGKPFIHFEPRQMPRNQVWRGYRDFAFEISPHGNGLDCHRTWEALLLKCIPIVKTSPLDSLYDGLPVVIVDEWRDIDAASLADWKMQYRDAFDGPIPDRLHARYWTELIRGKARESALRRAANV